MISGLSSNSEFLHFKLLIKRFLNFFSTPISNFMRLLLELTLSKIFISINFPFEFSRAFAVNGMHIKKNEIKLILN